MEKSSDQPITISRQDLIFAGKLCPYCLNETVFTDSREVYSSSYGPIYLCRPCDAYVGVHEGTTNAKGRLANAELRFWRKETHKYFDPIWMAKLDQGKSKFKARNGTYSWLCEEMGIPREYTHIALFDVEECQKAIAICQAANPDLGKHQEKIKKPKREPGDKTKRPFQFTGYDRIDSCLTTLKEKYEFDLWYDPKKFCYTIETDDDKGELLVVDYYPKANKVLVRRENAWKESGLKWLMNNL